MYSSQGMAQEEAVEDDGMAADRRRVAKMMARYGGDLRMLPQKRRQVSSVQYGIPLGAVECRKPLAKFALQDRFDRRSTVLEQMMVDQHKARFLTSDDKVLGHRFLLESNPIGRPG